jgi:DNA invertase Pin-like site-specific DNA recombinase
VLEFLHAGDVLMVTRIDRLARSIGDLQDIVRTVRARGAVLKATEQPINTGTAAGKCFLDMLGVFAEFETNLRRERQLEGIAKAKAAGVYRGRPPSIEASRVRELKAQGMRPSDIAKALKIGPWRRVLVPFRRDVASLCGARGLAADTCGLDDFSCSP